MLQSFDGNPLLEVTGYARGKSLVAWKAGKTIRSLPELIAKYHEHGYALGSSLRFDNLRVSRSCGRFALADTSQIGPVKKMGSMLEDWRLGGDSLDTIARKVLGDTPYPKDLAAYITQMRSAEPKPRLLFYNSLFLPPRLRYWLRVWVDQRFRKDYRSLPRDTKHKVQEFFGKVPYQGEAGDEGSLSWISENNEVVRAALAKGRKDAQDRRENCPNYNVDDVENKKRDRGRTIVCVNRDGLAHGTKIEKGYIDDVKRYMLTAENIGEMFHVEFDELDQKYIELCDEDDVLWEVLGIEEVFFESPETWKAAMEVLKRDIEASASNKSPETCPS